MSELAPPLHIGQPFTWSPPIIFITIFVTVFAVVIAITKDLADVEGDLKFKIETFATKLGVRNMAYLGKAVQVDISLTPR